MNLLKLVPSLLMALLFSGCGEQHADLTAPKTHQSGSITFDYPSNWKVTEDELSGGIHNLFIETPGEAIVIFQSFPTNSIGTLLEYAKEFSAYTAEETPMVSIKSKGMNELEEAGGFNWVKETFDISLLGETVPHTRLMGSKEAGEYRHFLILQVADEDLLKVQAGFNHIRDTLK